MRKFLKIAVTALSLAACFALVALWVRSYWAGDGVVVSLPAASHLEIVFSGGRVCCTYYHFSSPDWFGAEKWLWISDLPDSAMLFFPIWFPVLLTSMLAAAPWIKWRFSVRTLLIGLTVVAAILGLAVASN
jgi:hypothetical protein